MYLDIPQSNIELIQGLPCHVPPPGIVYNPITQKLEKAGIHSRSPRHHQQYWERPLAPSDWDTRRKRELETGIVDSVCERYRRQEWYRRLCGFWFMNKGNPTFLTGLHYFFLTHWTLGDEVLYPNYRERDREFFYFLDYTIKDPRSVGLVFVTKRREGKTAKSCVAMYEYISRTKKVYGGVQSKTEDDAREIVFQRGIVTPFTKLPDFFRPTFDTSGGKRPRKKLTFVAASRRGKAAIDSFGDEDLGSEIDFRSSAVSAYDGAKLAFYIGDEIFKSKDTDISERHRVVRLCCTDDRGQYTGTCLYTSTVEEIEGSIKDYRKFWEMSNQENRNANGRTATGLYRYFLPAHHALNYDQYGFEDINANEAFFLAERDSLKDNPIALNSEIRKNPFSIEEAFRVSNDTSIYDNIRINDQLAAIAPFEQELVWEGELIWTNGTPTIGGPDTAVVFKERKGGPVRLLKDQPFFKPNTEYFALHRRGSYFVPMNPGRFATSLDPFDHISTVDSRRSNGAAYLYQKYDSMNPEKSGRFILEYIYRAAHPNILYDDSLKIIALSGAPMLFEDNKQGFRKHCEERGFIPCLVHLPDRKEPGIPASTKTKQDLAETTKAYIIDSCHKVFFVRLLEDWRDFEILNTKQYDAAMAAGWCLVSDKSLIFAKNTSPNTTEGRLDISKIFR